MSTHETNNYAQEAVKRTVEKAIEEARKAFQEGERRILKDMESCSETRDTECERELQRELRELREEYEKTVRAIQALEEGKNAVPDDRPEIKNRFTKHIESVVNDFGPKKTVGEKGTEQKEEVKAPNSLKEFDALIDSHKNIEETGFRAEKLKELLREIYDGGAPLTLLPDMKEFPLRTLFSEFLKKEDEAADELLALLEEQEGKDADFSSAGSREELIALIESGAGKEIYEHFESPEKLKDLVTKVLDGEQDLILIPHVDGLFDAVSRILEKERTEGEEKGTEGEGTMNENTGNEEETEKEQEEGETGDDTNEREVGETKEEKARKLAEKIETLRGRIYFLKNWDWHYEDKKAHDEKIAELERELETAESALREMIPELEGEVREKAEETLKHGGSTIKEVHTIEGDSGEGVNEETQDEKKKTNSSEEAADDIQKETYEKPDSFQEKLKELKRYLPEKNLFTHQYGRYLAPLVHEGMTREEFRKIAKERMETFCKRMGPKSMACEHTIESLPEIEKLLYGEK